MRASGQLLLTLRGVCKSFGTVQAVRNVDLDIHAGSVHALVGENGAGKSTLAQIMRYPNGDAGAESLRQSDGRRKHLP